MKNSIFLLNFFISITLFSQTKLKVFDAQDDFRLTGANIYNNKQFLGQTDEIGEFDVEDSIHFVEIIKNGYFSEKVQLRDKRVIEVKMKPSYINLDEVIFTTNDSVGRNIIKKVIKNQSKNSIRNEGNIFLKSYTKFWSTINNDSIPYILNPKNHKDSVNNQWKRLLDNSHLFLGERAMDHKISKRLGLKNIVQSSRISGIRSPLYEYLAMQPVAFNFDKEQINFFFKGIVNPLSKEGLVQYRYGFKEDVYIDGRKTAMVTFFPSVKTDKRQIKGTLWIDDKTSALIKFEGENISTNYIAELEADWKLNNGAWVPNQQKYRMEAGNFKFTEQLTGSEFIDKKEKIWINLETNFKDIKNPAHFKRNEFLGYEDEISFGNMDDKKWDNVMEDYRDTSLSNKERNTYTKIDSIGDKYKLNQQARLMRILNSGGKLSLGKVDLDLTKILAFNDYEGFRLGGAFNTNENFSEKFSLNAYTAYGFKDKTFKYGFGGDYFVNKPYSGRLFAKYSQDVSASGRMPILLQSNYTSLVNNTFSNIYNREYFSYKKYSFGYEQDIFKNVTFNLSANYEKQKAEFDYAFLGRNDWFNLYNTQLSIRFAPKDKFIRTPYGRVTVNSGKSVIYATVTKYWDIFNSDYDPIRFNVSYFDVVDSKLGKSNININAGLTEGKMPLMNLFEGNGNSKRNDFLNFGLAGISNFETMLPGEFYSDRFVSFQIKHIFAGVKVGNKIILPQFVYRGVLGDMKNREDHQNLNFKTLNRYYHETGIEVNNILFKTFGVGLFYRLGAYSEQKFQDNLHLKLTINLNFL
ncbi:hypothetical protein SAMN05443634_105266 [Chishuiella changwenlii]|uniref:CarboxypepD_reg-like domain-containing protein n=1 Tax=Chishuiella changwenlii TaxID=1434701 RepID=A0A1M6XJ29_9FLAO|nr:hypothetical protein [Chishuiella changwenlii]GGF01016.1 hypothetical protein GCM10010984_18180 [Chishuiella changwenlii]SHL05994.1 hypothetical protein SAMN05443634_105266 [Chishuiella changwenlii]